MSDFDGVDLVAVTQIANEVIANARAKGVAPRTAMTGWIAAAASVIAKGSTEQGLVKNYEETAKTLTHRLLNVLGRTEAIYAMQPDREHQIGFIVEFIAHCLPRFDEEPLTDALVNMTADRALIAAGLTTGETNFGELTDEQLQIKFACCDGIYKCLELTTEQLQRQQQAASN